jgi:hypothetical protein
MLRTLTLVALGLISIGSLISTANAADQIVRAGEALTQPRSEGRGKPGVSAPTQGRAPEREADALIARSIVVGDLTMSS